MGRRPRAGPSAGWCARSALQDETEWYSSAVDVWVGFLVAALPVVAGAVLILSILQGEGVVVALLACIFVLALLRGLIFPLKYGIAPAHLIVQSGLVRHVIPCPDIRHVRPTRNPLSSPALSLNRLRVDYGGGFMRTVMISPERRDDFLSALARRTDLERHGDWLVPRGQTPPRSPRR